MICRKARRWADDRDVFSMDLYSDSNASAKLPKAVVAYVDSPACQVADMAFGAYRLSQSG